MIMANHNEHYSDPNTLNHYENYIIRKMRPEDMYLPIEGFADMTDISMFDIDAPSDAFYVGELNGEAVSCAIVFPCGGDLYYGSMFYVKKGHRKQGYFWRMHEEFMTKQVKDGIICLDATAGNEDYYKKRLGYVPAFKGLSFTGIATTDNERNPSTVSASVVEVTDLDFDALIWYDNKCYVRPNSVCRKVFLRSLIQVPGGAAYAAVDESGQVIGCGCRRPCIESQPGRHLVGPLYADSKDIAEALLLKLCQGQGVDSVFLDVWEQNEAMIELMKEYNFTKVYEMTRMHKNGNPREYKSTVYAVTGSNVCGF